MANQLTEYLGGRKPGVPQFEDNFGNISERYAQKYKNLYAQEAKYFELRKALAEKYNIEQLQKELKNAKLSREERLKLEQELRDKILEIENRSAAGAYKYREMMYKRGSATLKASMLKNEAELTEQKLKNIDEEYSREYALAEGNATKRRQLTLKHKRDTIDVLNEASKLRKEQYELEKSQEAQSIQRMRRNVAGLKEAGGNVIDIGLQLSKDIGKIDMKAIAKEAEERVKKADAELENLEADYNRMVELGASEEDLAAKRAEYQEAQDRKRAAALENQIAQLVANVQDTYKQAFNQAETMLTEYRGHIDARLQGSDKSYDDIMGKISTNLSLSPYVKTQKVIDTMKQAVDQGISYNVEQRAFLQSISDKIANTFDAFDSNLTRLIRLQQADTTAARMGMEASLTKFFNNMFQDTSYLQGLSDSVAGAIIDANASLSRNQSAEFEYIVQKWLGSLASVGMSDNTITNIATGLNYLATGDVTSLSSNTQLQTLFAMSAANAGLEYSDLLLKGLNADNTNKLLASMVQYLKEIAENSDSQVVRSAYGDIFNMSISDMKAISNLSAGDISNISASTLTYSAMNNELSNQMSQLVKRTSIAEMMSNLYNNAIFGVAEDMVSNPATYAMTKMLDFMDSSGLDMNIPFVNAMGFGVDLNTSVQDIMRLGVGLSQAFSLMGNILGGLGSGGGLNLSTWGGTEYTQRGSGMVFSTGSTFGSTSSSTYVATSSSQDMKNSALSSATDDAEETGKITNKNAKVEHSFDDFYNATIGESAKSYIKVQEVLLQEVFNNDQNYLGARDMRMSFIDNVLQTHDSIFSNSFTNVFGINSLLEDEGRLKVALPDKTIKIKPESDIIAVHIASASDSVKLASNTVSLMPGTSVSIDKQMLVEAFKEAMGHKSVKDDVKNMNDLIDGLNDGSIVVRIANETGRRLQVDTEALGTSGYASAINW